MSYHLNWEGYGTIDRKHRGQMRKIMTRIGSKERASSLNYNN